jgi:hypothetical protein
MSLNREVGGGRWRGRGQDVTSEPSVDAKGGRDRAPFRSLAARAIRRGFVPTAASTALAGPNLLVQNEAAVAHAAAERLRHRLEVYSVA